MISYIPAFSLLLVFFVAFVILLRKFTSEQLLEIFLGNSLLFLVSLLLYVTLLVLHLFQNQTWTADLLKIIIGIFVGASTTFVSSKEGDGKGVEIKGGQFGDHAKVAGRDINEIIENLQSDVAEIKDSVVNQFSTIEQKLEKVDAGEGMPIDCLVVVSYKWFRNGDSEIEDYLGSIIAEKQIQGWRFKTLSSDFKGIDGMMLVFTRPAESERGRCLVEYRM